jgi:hypothetical protein
MIPILPCRSIDDQIAFYESLQFEVTYRQRVANVFAAVQRGAIELQFFVLKGYEPAESYSTCYVIVSDVDALYAAFRAGLKSSLGHIPTRGIPRIGVLRDMSYGVRQFLLTDPGGNIIRIGQPVAAAAPKADAAAGAPRSRLEKALDAAVLLADSKSDPVTAASVLDGALAITTDADPALLVRAWILRADVAVAVGDDARASAMLEAVTAADLDDDARAALTDELARVEDLRRTIGRSEPAADTIRP